MRRIIAFLLLFLLLPLAASAQLTISTPVKISSDPTATEPVLHVGRDGTIYVSWYQQNADIYFSRSTDGGQTFVPPVRASRQATTNMYTSMFQRAPEFVIDPLDTIHLVWTEDRLNSQTDVWYIRSTDKGATWSKPMSIMDADDSQKYSQDFSAIACDSSGNLYVSYLDNRYLVRKSLNHYQMHMQRSTDGGQTWSKPVITNKLSVTNSGTCECCRQDIAVSPEGHVYIAYRTSQNLTPRLDDRSIYICRSWDKGVTWDSSIRCQLGTWNLTECPTKGPHVALSRKEDLFVAWNDGRDDSSGLISYFDVLPHGQSKALPNYSMSARSDAATWPSVAFSPEGYLAYTYMTSSGPVQFTYSSDGGNTWDNTGALPGASDDNQSLQSIAFDNTGQALIAWRDPDANGILCAKATNMKARPQLQAPASMIPATVAPSSQLILKWHKPSGLGAGYYVWYTIDVNGLTYGPMPALDTQLVAPGLPEGTYKYSIVAHTAFDSATTTGSFTVQSLGVDERALSATGVYPNPSKTGTITLHIDGITGLATIAIQNGVGATVKQVDVFAEDEALKLDAKDLAPGAYRARVTTVAGAWSLPFVIR